VKPDPEIVNQLYEKVCISPNSRLPGSWLNRELPVSDEVFARVLSSMRGPVQLVSVHAMEVMHLRLNPPGQVNLRPGHVE